MSLCQGPNCKKSVCSNCSSNYDHKVMCSECCINQRNKVRKAELSSNQKATVQSKGGFKKIGGIEVDKETGGLKGWTSIFSQLESEDAKA